MRPLEVQRLAKNFGGLAALRDVCLALEPGERRALIGPNGAGKTTLFNLISGVLAPSAGSIRLFGRDVTGHSVHRRAILGLGRTYQVNNLFHDLTVFENLLLGVQAAAPARFAMHRPARTYRPLVARAEELLRAWGLWDARDVPVWELSYGVQRQVEIVLSLARAPRLLLLDEPTAGLSPGERAAVGSMLRRLARETALLLIEHDMDVAFEVAETITVLHEGEVLAQGAPAAIKADPRVREIYLGTEKIYGSNG
ncbi:MAG TPA: ABC transporter ATP-binding protein [Candidatus Sulfotelmatobacter sp.]|nr:ABC transporter ATP-binding protein [Candidatus Sulfotelmatobacter sp.]